VLSGVWF